MGDALAEESPVVEDQVVSPGAEVAPSAFLAAVAPNVMMVAAPNVLPAVEQHAFLVAADHCAFREEHRASLEVAGQCELLEVTAQRSVVDRSVCCVVAGLNAEGVHQAGPSVPVAFQPFAVDVTTEMVGRLDVSSVVVQSSGGVLEFD